MSVPASRFPIIDAEQLPSCREDAYRLLRLLADGLPVTFQTFTDTKPMPKPDRLARWIHGTLAEHATTLAALNARGAGVFWMVNAGNGGGAGALYRRITAEPLARILARERLSAGQFPDAAKSAGGAIPCRYQSL